MWKTFLGVLGCESICLDHGGNEKSLVHINATADGICQFHLAPLLSEREAGTEPPCIQAIAETILSVRPLSTIYLCLKGSSGTD